MSEKVLILGGDGYLGWPTAMHFASHGYEVIIADNYYRRNIAEASNSSPLFENPNMYNRVQHFNNHFGTNMVSRVGDLADASFMFELVKEFNRYYCPLC